ncbi:MAG TPA: ATP-binding protein, partial [Pyrinomonadaceae bacterium]|nr:ATP-binding protein [Pyrinomonadaceae bacterium]
AEGALVTLLITIVSLLVYSELLLPHTAHYPIGHLTIPLLLWAAFRFGPRGAATAIAVMSAIAVWGTARGIGFFAQPDINGGLLMLQAYIADIAITALVLAAIVRERKRAQEKLRVKEAQLQLVTDTTPVMLTQCSRDLSYTFVNRAYAAMFGLTPEQVIGKPIVEIMGPEAFAAVHPYIETVLRGVPAEYEAEMPFVTVGRRWLRGAYLPDQDAAGNLRGWLASVTDITERKRADQLLHESESRLRFALVAGKMGAWEWTIKTGKVIWSAGLEEIHGLAPGTFGGTVADFKQDMHPEDWTTVEGAIENVLQTKGEYHAVYRFTRPDGVQRWAEAFGNLVLSATGEPEKLAGVCMDITDHKRAEEEYRQLLCSEHAARAEAEAANRTKDEFLATLSHELRTPLNAIVGWAGMLRTGKLDDENERHAIEIIDRNAKVQSQLIEDILDVSRIVSGKVRLEVRPVEVTQTIAAAVDSIRLAAQSKNIQLQVIADPAAGLVSGDPDRLQQIVWNLLSNAVKFTPTGGLVQTHLRRSNSDLQIVVKDNGQGISADFLPFVFERFRQADGSLTRTHKGLGLGLAIVRHLAELHGGSVKAASEGEGKGATFTVTLPLLTGWEELPAKGLEEPAASRDAVLALSGVRVLAVDDETDARELLTTILVKFGAEVKGAESATEALSILQGWRPDILISDVEMPGLDGYSLIEKIRDLEFENGDYLPAIALTAHARAEDRERALQSGFQIHISKPIAATELKMIVLGLTGRKGDQNTNHLATLST